MASLLLQSDFRPGLASGQASISGTHRLRRRFHNGGDNRLLILTAWIERRRSMSYRLKMLAIAAAVAAGASSAALAQVCPPRYALYGGVCQPAPSPGYTFAPNKPLSGAAPGAAER